HATAPARAQGARRQARAGRLRHRLLVAVEPAPAAGGHGQDRPLLRVPGRHQLAPPGADRGHREGRPEPGHEDCGRRHRNPLAARR
ncbi:hypothetical protein LTR94_037354, partial [Friedmanniomyces endolithicus]